MTTPASEADRVARWREANPDRARRIQQRADKAYANRERLLRELLLRPRAEEDEK